MDSRIEFLRILKNHCLTVHKSHSRFVDTPSNIHLTHEERLEMLPQELAELSRLDVYRSDDIYVYTTQHIYSAKKISIKLSGMKHRWKSVTKRNLRYQQRTYEQELNESSSVI